MTKTKFDWIDFLKKLAILGVPVALQNLLTTTGSMVDTIMIAPLGEKTVGAVGLCAQFSTLFFSCYWGFVGGGMLFFSQYWGAKDDKGISRAYGTTMVCMLTMSIIFFSLGFFVPNAVMRIYTDKEIVQNIGMGYLKIVCFSYPFQAVSVCISALLRGTERVKIPLAGSIISVLSNIILNWVFIYGKLGMPKMDERGAALATTIAACINLLVLLILAKKTKFDYIFKIKEHFLWTKSWIKEYLVKCFPIILNEFFVGAGFAINNIVLGRQSIEAIAAIAVFRTLEGCVIGFFAGFSSSASILVGKCVGAGEHEIAYERAKRIVLSCGVFIFMVCSVLVVISKPVLTAMSLSGESLRLGKGFLKIYSVFAVIRMCNWVQNDIYRSAGDAAKGSVLEIVFMYLMVIPCVALSGIVFKLPTLIVFSCCYIDEPIRFILMQIHMYSAKWIKPVTKDGVEKLDDFLEKYNKKR